MESEADKSGPRGCEEEVLWGQNSRNARSFLASSHRAPPQAQGPWEETPTHNFTQAVCGSGEGLPIFQILDSQLVMDGVSPLAKCLSTTLGMGT